MTARKHAPTWFPRFRSISDAIAKASNRPILGCFVLGLFAFGIFALEVPSLSAAEWPQWRGPEGQGVANDAKIAATWSEKENVVWRTNLPGRGWSSPVIDGDQIWLTTAHETEASEEAKQERLKENTGGQPLTVLAEVRIDALCLDKATGKVTQEIPVLRKQDPQWVHSMNSYASPTPVIEDGRLYMQNGSYGTACIDMRTGKVLWTNQELWVMHENGPGGSPTLWQDLLIFHMDGSDEQFIAAIDKHTGKVAWQTKRSGEMNNNPQLKKAYGSPIVLNLQGQDVVISPAANWLYGYDPATGKELWKLSYEGLGFSIVPKPVVGDGMLYIGTSYMKPRLLGIDITEAEPKIAWSYDKNVPAISSPLLVDGSLYFVSDKGGIVTSLDAKTGSVIYRERIGGNHNASPTCAGGLLLFHSREGETAVVRPGKEFDLLHRNQLDGGHYATAAISGDALFVRTDQALYRIEDR